MGYLQDLMRQYDPDTLRKLMLKRHGSAWANGFPRTPAQEDAYVQGLGEPPQMGADAQGIPRTIEQENAYVNSVEQQMPKPAVVQPQPLPQVVPPAVQQPAMQQPEPAELPMNSFRNELTGKVTGGFVSQPDVYAAPAVEQTVPKGYSVTAGGYDGPGIRVLQSVPQANGTVMQLIQRPVINGAGQQSMTNEVRVLQSDAMNPVKLAEQKYKAGETSIAHTQGQTEVDKAKLYEAQGLDHKGQPYPKDTLRKKQWEQVHGPIPKDFELYPDSDGKTDIRPAEGTKQYNELMDRVNKFGVAKRSSDEAQAQIDKLVKHPGREWATGTSGMLNPIFDSFVGAGSQPRTFLGELRNLQSRAFLANIDKLRGTGPLSDREGAQLKEAIGNLDPGQNEESFLNNLKNIRSGFESLRITAEKEAVDAKASLKRDVNKNETVPTGGKVTSMKEIASLAMRRGVDPLQLRKEAIAKGYQVKD